MTDSGAVSVAPFDVLPHYDAAAIIESCCGSSAWVQGMIARRPFGTLAVMLDASDRLWWSLTPEDWREAFDHHPRIGERSAAAPQSAQARDWSASEQRAASEADADARRALAAGNREYEQRFGYIYLVCATGKSAQEMLDLLHRRLHNDPATELQVAAAEQAKITRLRLQKLFGDPPTTQP